MRTFTTLGLSVAALAAIGFMAPAHAQSSDAAAPAADTSTPAPAKTKPTHHAAKKPDYIHRGADSGDAAVDDLNAKSLSAAKTGTAFKPDAATEAKPASKPVKAGSSAHHHSKKKPAAKPAADAAAADTSK